MLLRLHSSSMYPIIVTISALLRVFGIWTVSLGLSVSAACFVSMFDMLHQKGKLTKRGQTYQTS